eukprot:TRINITY_DN14386_c0_g1_i1.p1 TRINITY_DN14386_c0_g1~~TRINITY_DN14386_c0_g1_i1.p1  ORF type:complete len:168 (-),score=25.00 TRINITY_DN14386_c0_g1_i1:73-576(-)
MKGQKARNTVRPGFEGGDNPMYKRVRKRGFRNFRFKKVYVPVNLGRVQYWIDTGRLSTEKTITMEDIFKSGLIGSNNLSKSYLCGMKVLADGAQHFTSKVDLQVSKVSAKAREAIEQNGGTVKEVYYHKLYLKRILRSKGAEPLGPPQEYRQSVYKWEVQQEEGVAT